MGDREFRAGQPVLYRRRGGDSFELGVVKSVRDDGGCFVWYSSGDTAALTPADCLFAFDNDAEGALRVHGHDSPGSCRYEGSSFFDDNLMCSECGFEVRRSQFVRVAYGEGDVGMSPLFKYCPGCGARVEVRSRE